ncbi:peptidase C39 [Hapalosiphon sp. MRB220]|nr:peptidase C39 [Hapalosiphon sp. MRB220]
MTQTSDTIQTFLSGIPPFKQLSSDQLQQLCQKLQLRRFGMGQAILPLQELPPYIAIIYTGQARLIGNNSHSDIPVTLHKLKPGEIVGWRSLLQGIPCEKVMACEEETLCLVLPSEEFLTLLEEEPSLKAYFVGSSTDAINSKDAIHRVSTIPDSQHKKYPHKRDSSRNATLACLQMVSQYFGMPFRKENIRRAIANNHKDPTKPVSLQLCGAIADFMGLKAQLVTVPANAMNRLPTPALIHWQDSMAVVYETSDARVVLGVPERGIVRQKMAEFLKNWGEQAQVLLLTTTSSTPQQKFGLSWFLPSLNRHRTVLLEVLIASFFVQLFGLANPLMIQVIIDKVLVQNSIDTLQVLGVFLLLAAIFEAVLGTLRTYLFAEATNRIDLALGSEIIDHLLRLPLRYFDRHPVGELATRVNELENIRSFLTGTALTVVLDSVFSVIYIVVMVIYSWVLTLVSLSTIPLFAILSLVAAPIVRRQLREKAERNAQTQSYLVEVLSGIQTVKAQNIELRTRWQWQEHYARYVSSGFKTIVTSTAASSASNFLNQLSGLLVLWVGAYLVLKGELSLGQLIAFRIIAGYVTSPLLRLLQLWQNFQQTALSLERLSDIVDTPQEVTQIDQDNIPMPVIQGAVTYENVSFRFAAGGSLQLDNINLAFAAQRVVGIVGMSGSGKSTLMKLLPRLYELNAGRILIDGYDISKVELYSLRSQIGIIPQDTLLFDGTVLENIALTNPEATSEEVITAAKIAVAHDFIMNLPNGYNTRVGERGSALSGGQRQRIAIARTILQNPQLLILDEATSALDYDTERQVCTNLIQAFRGRTMFIITHRLSTIQQADEIVLMHQGKVTERGTHNQLMHQRGRYYHLYQQQDGVVVG